MKDINLYFVNKKERKKKGFFSEKIIILAGLLGMVVLGGAYYFLNQEIEAKNSEVSAIQTQINGFSQVRKVKESISTYEKKIKTMSNVIQSITSKSVINTVLFQKMSKLMPEDIFLENYSVSNAGELKIQGKSKNNDSIAYFLQKLDESKMFSEVKIQSIKKHKKDNGKNEEENQNQEEGYLFVISIKVP